MLVPYRTWVMSPLNSSPVTIRIYTTQVLVQIPRIPQSPIPGIAVAIVVPRWGRTCINVPLTLAPSYRWAVPRLRIPKTLKKDQDRTLPELDLASRWYRIAPDMAKIWNHGGDKWTTMTQGEPRRLPTNHDGEIRSMMVNNPCWWTTTMVVTDKPWWWTTTMTVNDNHDGERWTMMVNDDPWWWTTTMVVTDEPWWWTTIHDGER